MLLKGRGRHRPGLPSPLPATRLSRTGSGLGVRRPPTTSRGRRKNGLGRCRGMHRRLKTWVLEVLLDRPEDNGVTMVSTPMGQVCTVARRPRAVVEVTLGRATVRQSDRSWIPRVALLRVLLARILDNVLAAADIVVVGAGEGAGTVLVRRHHRLLSSRRQIAGLLRTKC